MNKKYLTYLDLINNIDILSSEFIKSDVNIDHYSILFTPREIILTDPYSIMSYDVINLVKLNFPDKFTHHRTRLIISRPSCKINRGGWIKVNNNRWFVNHQYKYYDIVDFWIYEELIKHPEIIKRILASRIRFQGIPCETDKFQGFWMGDVNFKYL